MITDHPNERSATGIVSNPTKKKPRWKKVLLIVLAVHLIFTLLDACVFRGPCAYRLIEATGPGYLVIDQLEYHVRPRQNEIVMTWTESFIRGRSHWGEGEKHSRSIPLDPLPPEFARCYVDVSVDPDAPAMFPMPFNTDLLAPIPYLGEENVIGTDPEIPPGPEHPLPPDMVVHLRVRPEDVSALSEQFYVALSRYDGTLMVPYSKAGNGRRKMLMTTTHDDPRPYYVELLRDAESRPHKMPSRGLGMLERIVLMPFVVFPDYVFLFCKLFVGIWILRQFQNVDW